MSPVRLAIGMCAAALCSLALAGPAMAVTFHVDTLTDEDDTTLNGSCDTDGGSDDTPCTLRAAISEANDVAGPDEIVFDVTGVHPIASTLNVNGEATIIGNGSGISGTVIEGNDTFRLFATGSEDVTFQDMRLEDGGLTVGDTGAGISFGDDGTLSNVTVTSNQISGTGGGFGAGVSALGGSLLGVTDSTVSNNTVSNSDAAGAGIYTDGDLQLTESTVSGNVNSGTTVGKGGGIYAGGGLSVNRSTISGNSAAEGGGIFSDNPGAGAREIVNSTISGNTGGGGVVLAVTTTVDGTTLAGNTTTSSGADIKKIGSGTATVRNSILASSATDSCAELGGTIESASPGNNIDIGTSCAFGTADGNQEDTDADMGPLAVNAPGTTATHDIAPNGPAMNTGGDCASALPTDQRGVVRPQGEECDVGAYEIEHETLSVTRVGSGTVTGTGINCPTDCAEAEPVGTQIALTPTPAAGFSFTGWSGDCTGSGACEVTLDAARNVTATFTSDKTANVSVAGTGSGGVTATQISCPGDCAGSYTHGTVLVLTAAASSGSSFTGWSGCDSTAGTQCTLNMTSDRLVTATFTADPVTPPPGGGGPSPTPKKCKKGFVKKKGKCVKKKRKKK